MIQINPLKSYIDGGVRAAITTPPSASLVFDLPGKAIWVKGVKLKGTDHTYTFSHDNYITLTNTSNSNESEDIKIGVNTSALKNAIDTTYGVVSTTTNGLAPKFTSENKQAASTATTYYFLGWTGSTLKWYQAPFRNVRINSETTDRLGINNTDPLIISSGNGISVTWDSTNKKIIITNTKPDVNHNTHYTTMLYIGENNDTKANKNVANPYLKLFDDSIRRATFQIKAGSGIAVTSDTNGNITITNSSPDVNHNTDRTGIKLTTVSGTKKTDSTLILSNSTTGLNIQGGTNKFLIGDGTNYIEVPVVSSVSNKDATIGTALTTIATISGIDIKAKIASYSLSNHTHLVKINGSTKTIAASGAVDLGNYLPLSGGTMGGTAWIVWPDSGNISNNNEGVTFPVIRGGLEWRGQTDYIKLFSEETGRDNLNLVLQFGDDNSNGLSIRNKSNTQTSYISSSGVITTGTFKGNLDWSYITNKPSSYIPSAHTHAWNSLTHSSTTENQAILTNGKANGWKLYTLNISGWNNAANNAHSHSNKSILDGITSTLVSNWNTAYTFVNTITGTDTDKVINKWDEIVNFLAGITEDNKLNTLLNSKLSVYELADNTNVGAIKNNGIYYSTSDSSSGTLLNSPFSNSFTLINMISYDGGDDLRRSRLAFNAYGEVKVSNDRGQANTAETWYNVLTSNNSGISGSTIKLNGTSITVYSSSTADGRYVKKAGDTMSGVLTIDTTGFGALTIKRNDDTNGASIQFRGKSSVYGYIGLNNSTKDKQFLRWNSDTSKTYTILDTSSTYTSNGKGVINGTTITQVDNADTTDGVHLEWSGQLTYDQYSWLAGWTNDGKKIKAVNKSQFATSGHTHDDRYLRLTGGWMSGDINFGGDNSITWGRNTDSASISFKNDGDGDSDSYMSFVTSDNGNEYFRWSHSSGSTNIEWMALRSDGLRVGGTKVSLEGHSHNDLYYTKTEVNNKLNGKSDTSHTHDDRYLKLTGGIVNGAVGINATGVCGNSVLTVGPQDKRINTGIVDRYGTMLQIVGTGKKNEGGVIGFHNPSLYSAIIGFVRDTNETGFIFDTDVDRNSWYVKARAFKGLLLGNANSATQLQTARTINGTIFNGTSDITTIYWGATRTISLTGAVTGSVSTNGSSNITINTTYGTGNITNLDSRYLKRTGDTMSGTLSFSPTDASDAAPKIYSTVSDGLTSLNFEVSDDANDRFVFKINYWNDTNTTNRERFIIDQNNVISKAPITAPGFYGNATSATKLQTSRTIWGQSFDGTGNVDNTLRIRQTTGNYCEGIRIQTADGAWSTIILGATADSGTNTNAWSIHRKADNNFAISRNSSDGVNGLVMTSVGMGLGTTAPTHRLDVRGDTKITGSIRDLAIGGGIYWNPYVESTTDSSDVASITVVKSGVAGGTTLVLSQMNDFNDTIQFKTNTAAKLYHNSYPILTTQNTYVSNNKGYINGTEITQVNNSDKVDNRHAISTTPNTGIIYKAAIYTSSSLTSYWVRLASIPSISQNDEFIATVHVQSGHSNPGRSAILLVYLRGSASSFMSKSFKICCNSNYDPNRFRLYYKDSDKTSEIWYQTTGQWDGIITTVISQSSEGSLYEGLTLYSGSITAVQTPSISTYLSAQVSTITDNISGNAATATKLQTARKIWGQSFDGTRDVSGSLSGVGHIQFSADNSYSIGTTTSEAAHTYTRQVWTRHLNASRVYTGDTNLYIGYNNTAQVKFYSGTKQSGDGSNERMTISTNGNVGIGTTSPTYKLHVVGDIYTTTGFKKNGSSDSYVLLGGGGHKLESSLSVASASVASKVYGQVGDTGSHELVRCDMNNDQFRIIAGSNGNNNGWVEIATADDGNEPIYVRQYTGVFSSVKRTLTLLDTNGYSHFPSYINIGGNENNNSSPDRVWGSNSSDSYLRSYRTSALNVAYAASAGNATVLLTNNTAQAADACYNESPGLRFWRYNGTSSTNGQGGGDGWIMSWSWNQGSVGGQIYVDDNPTKIMCIRGRNKDTNKTFTTWATILHSDNYTSYCATTNHTHSWSSITNKPCTLISYSRNSENINANNWRVGECSLIEIRNTELTYSNLAMSGFNSFFNFWTPDGIVCTQFQIGDSAFYYRSKQSGSATITTNWNRIMDSNNCSVSKSGETLTVKINGTSQSLTNTWRGIQDNLTSSTNTTQSLSAKQGYLLANGSARDNTKLPLSGGTMTGVIKSTYTSGSWINGVTNAIIKGMYTGYGAILSMPVKDGRVSLSSYPGSTNNIYFGYATTQQINAGTNSFNKQMYWDAVNNNLHADVFTGSLVGNASTATTATKLGTANVGATNIPIYLKAGVPISVTLIDTANNLINNLTTGTSTPVDADYYVAQYVGGGTTTTTFHRRPHSSLYSYIKGKAEGTWNISITGNANTVDGQHFNWNNNKNDHTYLWAASNNGNAYLVHRASISVNYANSAGNADTLDGNHASAFALVGHTHNYDNVYSKLGHTHDDRYYTESEINSKLSAYLPLAGGTMTGQIKGNNKGGSWIQGRANAALYQPRNVQDDWHPVIGFKTKTGSWEFGSVGSDDFATFSWGSDSNYNSGTNTTTVVYLRNTRGTIALTSEIPTVTNYYWANMKVSSTSSTSTSPTFSTCYTNNWFRSTGQTGWYNETYEGGWYMTDTTWVRTYNSKGIYTNTGTIYNLGHVWLACNNGYNVGIGTTSPSYKLHVSGDSYATGWSRAASGFYCQDTGVHFTHNGTKGQIAMTSNNEFCWGANSNILYFNYAASSYGTTVTQYVWNAGSSSSYASHTMGHITLGNGNYQLKRVGSASSWYNGRDKAIVRQTSNAGDYCVIMSSKTANGSWEIGNDETDLCFTYITDSNYNNKNNNNPLQIWFTYEGIIHTSNYIQAAHFYENSDVRYKKILKNLSINSNTIANLPLFDFEWIENNSIGTGTSAQAVQQILPNLVSGTDKLTLDYGVLGTIAGITACKELVMQKSELQQLKEKVKQLEDKLRKYENI